MVQMADIENCWLVCRAGLGEVKEADEEFGVEMFDKFLHSLEKRDLEGEALCFYTEGVQLLAEDSKIIESLKLVEKLGMKIVICGTCVDYFDLEGQIEVGEIGTMAQIVELLRSADNVTRV